MKPNRNRGHPVLIGLVSFGGIIGMLLLYAWPVATSEPTSLTPPYRAFSDASYWNTPLPAAATLDPNSEGIIDFLEQDNRYNFVRLAGTDSLGRWGNPIYWSGQDDPVYDVGNTCLYRQPPEFRHVRIPVGARPDPTSDAAMSIYNVERGIVYAMHWNSYDAEHDAWSACGGTVYYLRSNGLHGKLHRSNDPRNTGHRGVPPPTYAVRFDEVEWGSIDHVLKIAVSAASSDHVFPMVGSDGVSADPSAPPEGARLRIKPSVDLETLDLSPPALVIAQTLQHYGAVIGDQSGGNVNLKVENTVAEGRGQLWDGVLSADSLSTIPFDDYEVVQLGYKPRAPAMVRTLVGPTHVSSSSVSAERASRARPNPEPTSASRFGVLQLPEYRQFVERRFRPIARRRPTDRGRGPPAIEIRPALHHRSTKSALRRVLTVRVRHRGAGARGGRSRRSVRRRRMSTALRTLAALVTRPPARSAHVGRDPSRTHHDHQDALRSKVRGEHPAIAFSAALDTR